MKLTDDDDEIVYWSKLWKKAHDNKELKKIKKIKKIKRLKHTQNDMIWHGHK